MTIIVYSDKTLYADSLGIENVGHTDIFSAKLKIFRSPCNRFAYGVAGLLLSGNMQRKLHDLLLANLTMYYTRGKGALIPNKTYDDHKSIFGETIIITKTDLWVITSASAMSMHTDLNNYVGMGSGVEYFTAAKLLGKTTRQALQLTIDNCCSCGGPISAIPMKSLKPFKMVVAK